MFRSAIILLIGLAICSADRFAHLNINCTRENEELRCDSACQTTCRNLDQLCHIINIICNEGCYCKKGYARIKGDNSSCIPINECPRRRHRKFPRKK